MGIMGNSVTYIVNGKELYEIINAADKKLVNENTENEKFTYGDMFGIKTSRENRVNAIRYAKYYGQYYQKVQAIADEVDRRVQLLTNASQQQQINEIGGALGKIGTKLAAKGITKASAKTFGKKAAGVVGKIGLASIPAFIVGPENIQAYFQKFNSNRAQVTPKEVIVAYDELATWMQNICAVLQEHPEILGAGQLTDETLNGPEAVDSGPMFDAADAVELAASIGVYAIPYVGWALGAIDLVHSVIHAGADANKEGLKMVENQMKYLDKAIANINAALSGKAANGQQRGQNPQQQTAGTLPNGYVVGQPAPFAKSDPQQVQRLQGYLGLQQTGSWDRNTQSAWDNWLRRTYLSKQSVGRTTKNITKNVGRAVVSTR